MALTTRHFLPDRVILVCNIPNFQFGMLYIDHSCISYFVAFCFTILEILSNSRTLEESWGFPCFHIWVLSNIETRIFGFNYFSLRKYFILKYMRGDNMTSPKWLKYWRKILKSNIWFYSDFIAILFALEKLHVFQNCILGPRKCSSCSKYFI